MGVLEKLRRWWPDPTLTYVVNGVLSTSLIPRDVRAQALARCGIQVARSATVSDGVRFGGRASVTIGEGAFIHGGVFIDGHVTIGPRVALGRDVLIATYEHERGPSEARAGRLFYRPVVIEEGARVSTRSVIIRGVRIGRGAQVAAGSVVTKDVPADTLVGGVPARVIRELGQ